MSNELDKLIAPSDSESEVYKTVKEFFASIGDTDIRTKTILPDLMITKIIRAIYYANECARFETSDEVEKVSDIVRKTILDNYYTLKISVKGKGREQFFKFASGHSDNEKESKFKNMFGLK